MIPGAILTLVPLLLGLFAAQPSIVGQTVTRLVIEDQVILRVPVEPRPSVSIEWHEKKGPRCIPMRRWRPPSFATRSAPGRSIK